MDKAATAMNQSERPEQPEETVRRVFVIRLWQSNEARLSLRGEVALVGKERPIYVHSLGELMDCIQTEMNQANEADQEPRAGLR
jgi:hypothetical protein